MSQVSLTDYLTDVDPALDANWQRVRDAFGKAFASSSRVYIPPGVYVVNGVELPAGAEVFGAGPRSVLRQRADAAGNQAVFDVHPHGPADPGTDSNAAGIHLHDFVLRGRCDSEGFGEFAHLVFLSGVSDVLIERMRFIGFRGDALVLGSTYHPTVERHNRNVTVRSCIFDGLNRQNRQAITVIDVDGLLIEGCEFRNTTRPDMPGAIDIEPNPEGDFSLVRNVGIRHNRFRGIGGSVGVVSIVIPPSVRAAPRHVQIVGNEFVDSLTSTGHAEVHIETGREIDEATDPMHIVVENNLGHHGSIPLRIFAAKGVQVRGNCFRGYTNEAIVGYTEPHQAVHQVQLSGNQFIECGHETGNGVLIGRVSALRFSGNLIDDCGNGSPSAVGLRFISGRSSQVQISDNHWRRPKGRMAWAIYQDDAVHATTAALNAHLGSVFDTGLQHRFTAEETDVGLLPYTPVLGGSSIAGTGIYTQQYGAYRRQGGTVYFELVLALADHSGSGIIEISLPLDAYLRPGNEEVVLGSVMADNLAADRSLCAFLNAGAMLGGRRGVARIASAVANQGAIGVQFPLRNTPFKIRFAGSFIAAR